MISLGFNWLGRLFCGMARMFLSYRRADGVASGARSLIYQKMGEHHGPKSVFMDVERTKEVR